MAKRIDATTCLVSSYAPYGDIPPKSAATRISHQRGQALLILLILLLSMGVLAASLTLVTANNAISSRDGMTRAVALSTADIAIERVKGNIARGELDTQFSTQSNYALVDGDVYTLAGHYYGGYKARVTKNYGNREGQYLVVSQGTLGTVTRQVNIVLRRNPPQLPNLAAAIPFYGANAASVFHGLPSNISGLDTNLPSVVGFATAKASDCVAGSGLGPDVIGIGVHDNISVTETISALGTKTSRVTGTDGNGGLQTASVYNVAQANPSGLTDQLTATDIANLAQQYAGLADYVHDSDGWLDRSGDRVDDGSFGTVDQPRVVVLRASAGESISLSGNLSGAGVLIIDSSVRLSGTFNYAGTILVTNRGDVTVSLDMTGTPLIMGAILVANPLEDGSSLLSLAGTADVFFSRQGLDCAQRALTANSTFENISSTERKPAPEDVALPSSGPASLLH